jgi:hypothetical protein
MSMNVTNATEQMIDRTSDIADATIVVFKRIAQITRIEGERGRRVFVFDREIPASLLLGFHSSEARQVLDTFRAVKRMVHTD